MEFFKNRIEHVMLNFLATTEKLRKKTRTVELQSRESSQKSSWKLLLAISRQKNHKRVELSYPEIGDRTNAKEEDINSKWTRVNLRWKGGQPESPNGPVPKAYFSS